jgi:hypothetical protein
MANSTDIVTLAQVSADLGWSSSQTSQHAQSMGGFISAMTPVVEQIVGPVIGQSFDEWYSGGAVEIALRRRPILSVDSLTETTGSSGYTLTQATPGTPADSYGYTLDKALGIITRRANGTATPFADGDRNIHVTYTAGWATSQTSIPANIVTGTLMLIRFHWQPEQAGNQPGFGNSTMGGAAYDNLGDGITVLGYLVPNRVASLLRAGSRKVGIA